MHVCYTLFMGDRAIRFISNFTYGEFIILLPERLQPFINSLSQLSLLAHLHQLPLISHYSDYLISAPSATPEFKHPTCRILRAFRIPAEADRLPGVNHLFLRLGNLPSYERASARPPVSKIITESILCTCLRHYLWATGPFVLSRILLMENLLFYFPNDYSHSLILFPSYLCLFTSTSCRSFRTILIT